MNYNLYNLNPNDFESLVQSLMQKLLGSNSLVFGAGRDGGRELTYEGSANFPNNVNSWNGYWVIQAKYKSRDDREDDYSWVERQFKKDIEKFNKPGYVMPDNYIFLTNVVLTPVAEIGGRDRIEELKKKYSKKVKNIFIGGYDEMSTLLNNNRDVATLYSSFIFSGDVLSSVYDFFKYASLKKEKALDVLSIFLQKEFNNELRSKLIQAGDLVRAVNLENVFVDLLLENEEHDADEEIAAVKYLIDKGNSSNKSYSKKSRIVLVGGAGAGKSTLTQFICQYYTANFLKNSLNKNIDTVNNFLDECKKSKVSVSNCLRFPIKIVLKDYSGWVNDRKDKDESVSLLQYIIYRINLTADGSVDTYVLRDLFKKISFVFVFDGLDEVPASSNRDVVIKEINDFIDVELQGVECDSLIIATTRPQGYTKEFNEEIYEHFSLAEMTDSICLEYLNKLLRNIDSSVEDRIAYIQTLQSALKNDVTGRLMRTPLQATIMTILVVSGGEPSANKYSLFKKYYDTIFNREKQKKVSKLINLHETHINKIHNILGYKLQLEASKAQNPYSNIELYQFESLIKEYLISEEWQTNEIEGFIFEFRNTITHRLVFITESQDNKVGFVVRSLQEFFAANYYMDTDDNSIDSRIRTIATSSYWRNTLIFSIGNLRVNRDYKLNEVFSICQELNGLGELPNLAHVNTHVKAGSWLALDILTEGIISDTNRFPNKFASLLEDIIDVPPVADHHKFRKLNDSIKRDWIVNEFLKKKLEKGNINNIKTVYYISSLMLKFGNLNETAYLKELLIKNAEGSRIMVLMSELYDLQIVDDFFEDIFKKVAVEYEGIYILNILRREVIVNKSFFLERILPTLNPVVLEKIIELILLLTLEKMSVSKSSARKKNNTNYKFINKILNTGRVGKKVDIKNISRGRMVSKASYSFLKNNIYLIEKVKDEVAIRLKEVLSRYKSKYLFNYIDYLQDPSLSNLKNLVLSLNKEHKVILNIFKSLENDWLLNYSLRALSDDLNEEKFIIYLNKIGIESDLDMYAREAEIIETNRADIWTQMATTRSYMVNYDSKLLPKIHEAYNDYLNQKDPSQDTFLDILIVLYSRTVFLLRKKNVNFDYACLNDVFLRKDVSFQEINMTDYVSACYALFTADSRDNLYNLIDNNNPFKDLKLSSVGSYLSSYTSEEDNAIILENVVDVVNIFLGLSKINKILTFTAYVLTIMPTNDNDHIKEKMSNLNFRLLYSMTYLVEDNRLARFILLLFSDVNYWPNERIMNEELEFLIQHNIYSLNKIMECIVSHNINSNWVIRLIIHIINSDLSPDFSNGYNLKSEYFEYLKEYSENYHFLE